MSNASMNGLKREPLQLVGDKSIFAIECEVCDVIDTFVYCNFRFWVAGEPLGDWNMEVVLGVLMHSAEVFMRYKGNRYLELANSNNTEMIWKHINNVANSDDPEDLRISLEGGYRSRFLLHEIADDSVATVCKIIIVEQTDGVQRLLWQYKGSNDIQELILPKLTVDNAVTGFLGWAKQNNPQGQV